MNALERLSLFCYFGGLFSVFVGVVVALIDLLNADWRHIQTGIFIFASGYALFKIGSKISAIVASEQGR